MGDTGILVDSADIGDESSVFAEALSMTMRGTMKAGMGNEYFVLKIVKLTPQTYLEATFSSCQVQD